MALRLLIIEGSEDDAVLLVRELRKGGFDLDFKRVESLRELAGALDEGSWDAVLADPKMPTPTCLNALRIIQAKGLDIPFILLSGEIEADEIVKMMKAGAHDFIKKGDFAQLMLALKQELQAAETRRKRRQTAEALQRIHDELEARVRRRTDELERSIAALRIEAAERVSAEKSLRQAHRRIEAVLASVADIHFLYDRQWRCLYVNKAAIRALGRRQADQILGRNPWELFPDIVGTEIEQQYHRAMEEQVPVTSESYYPTRDAWWENRFYPSPEGLSVFATNITLRKKAEEALRESEKRFRGYFELGLVGTAITTPGKGFLEVNRKFCEIFGYEQDELVRMKWAKLIHPNDLAANIAHYNRVLAGGTDGYSLESKYIRKDGLVIDVALSMKCLRRADDSLEYCVTHLQDITERKEKESEIMSYQRQLRGLAAELALVEERERRKIAVALHDQIGQPLALASIKLGKLRQEVDNEHLGEQVDSIRGMLAYAIGSSRMLTFELSPPILYELGLEAAVSSLAERYRQELDIRIDCRNDDSQPKPLSDDVCILLFQGVRELLTNALKHARAQRITISIWREGINIRIKVEDDGVGFNPEDKEILAGKDQGFGLFSLRERMNYLGGNLAIESFPDGGTRAILTAPLRIEPEEQEGEVV